MSACEPTAQAIRFDEHRVDGLAERMIPGDRGGTERDHRKALAPRAQCVNQFRTVHLRHAEVREQHVIATGETLLESDASVFCAIDGVYPSAFNCCAIRQRLSSSSSATKIFSVVGAARSHAEGLASVGTGEPLKVRQHA